ncbi:MAG: AI-2E family transporter [Verrucomicrobiota bacterium]|nr:AI-2E family transporter [Verrucomicrobiota bacterium]
MSESNESKNIPSDFQKAVTWKAITGVSFAIIFLLLISSIFILGKFLNILQPVLVPVAIAAILSYLLSPLVHWIRKKALREHKLSRTRAILLVYSALTIFFTVIALMVIIPASSQLNELIQDREKIIKNAQKKLSSFSNVIESFNASSDKTTIQPDKTDDEAINNLLWNKLVDWIKNPETSQKLVGFLGKTANGFVGVLGYALGLILVPVYLFFFLRDSAFIERNWDMIIPLKNSTLKDEIVSLIKEINGYIVAYFRGQVLVSVIDGALTGIILMLLGLDYALVIGVSLAIFGVIPFVGFIITAIPALLIAAGQDGGPGPLWVLIVFIAVQQFDGFFIQHKIVGESVGLHPLTVIFSVLCWSLLIGGILGALLAVPLTASIKVLFRRYVWENKIKNKFGEKIEASPT